MGLLDKVVIYGLTFLINITCSGFEGVNAGISRVQLLYSVFVWLNFGKGTFPECENAKRNLDGVREKKW
jgi:hypothetical protein